MARFNHFDLMAPYYDRFIAPTDSTRISTLAGLPATGLLLDLGGGTGQKSQPLLKMVSGIVIADSSKGMTFQAKKKSGLTVICSESERLPFNDGSFGRVIMVDALHHVADYKVTTDEMWRVTKPGGRIVIEEPDIRTMPVKIMAIIEKIALMRSHFVSPPGIATCFNHPAARVYIEVDRSTAWIVIDKLP